MVRIDKAEAVLLSLALSFLTYSFSFTAQSAEVSLQEKVDAKVLTSPLMELALMEEVNGGALESVADATAPQPMESADEEYVLEGAHGKLFIAVRRSWESGHAGVYVNNQEVIRFRTMVGEWPPTVRARHVANGLYEYLKAGGAPETILPGVENGQVVIQGGQTTLVTIDAKTAKDLKLSEKTVALIWTNLIRRSLGVDPIACGKDGKDCHKVVGRSARSLEPRNYRSKGNPLTGVASWYGPGFHGRRAANGTRFDMNAYTAAHRSLPFGTLVKVLNHGNGKSCVVKITDRGPFIGGRIIDLSFGAAKAIGAIRSGIAKVSIQVIQPVRR